MTNAQKLSLCTMLIAFTATSSIMVGCKPAEERQSSAIKTERPAPTSKGNVATGDSVKIGLVSSLTGELAPWGSDCLKAVQIAVEEANKQDGINGKKIELLTEDSASKPEQGKSAADEIIRQGAVGVIGEVASGIMMQIANSAFEKGVPTISVGATRTDITSIGSNIFRVCYTDDFQGPVMAKFAYEDQGLRRVAIVTDKSLPYSTGLSTAFREKFEALGGKIVGEEFYDAKATQFTGQLTQIKGLNPDGMFLSGYFTEVGQIARQARNLGIKATLLGGDGWDTTDILSSGGEAILGGYFCNHYNNMEDRPEVREFMAKWKTKFGKLPGTTMGALAYDAANVMIEALRKSKTLDSQTLNSQIEETTDFKGVTGVITLKGLKGSPRKRALVVQVKKPEGQVFVKAYEYADVMN